MSHDQVAGIVRATVVLAVVVATLAASARADITVQHNVAFNATKRNPYTGGGAFEESKTYSLLNESIRADIPPIDADPLGVALEAFFGVDLPSVVELQVGGTVAGHAKVEFGYYVTSGRLDINYPASNNLTVQTAPGANQVFAGQSYTIGSQFLPGVSPRVVTSQFLQTEGGAGYLSAPLLAFNNYEKPSFATTSPWASAWLDAEADIRAGMFAKVSALAGLQEWRKEFRAGGKLGGRLVEIDPTGLYVSGEQVVGIDLDQPIGPFPIAAGAAELTVRVPRLDVASRPADGAVVVADAVKPIMTLTGNLEKLIPFVGNLLHHSIGPFEYDLLQLKGGPQLGLYQTMTFTPDPRLQLAFSEPVLVRGNACPHDPDAVCGGPGGLLETFKAEIPLGAALDWQPMFSNTPSVTIKPTYLMKNQFRNETGLDLSLLVDVESLSLKAPFFPTKNNTVGPIIDKQVTIPIGRFPSGGLFTKQFEIPLPSVTGDAIVVPKVNVGLEIGLGDLNLVTSTFVGPDPQNPGSELYDLTFNRTVQGGPPRQYHARVSGVTNLLDPEGVSAATIRTHADVVLTDPVTNQPIAVGRNFCLGNCDLSSLQPTSSPAYLDPNPAHGKLYVTHLPDNPNIDVDVVSHSKLGQSNAPPPVNTIADTEYGVDVVDKLNRPITTIVARKGEIIPNGISEFNSFSPARIRANGEMIFQANLSAFAPETATRGVYSGDDAAKIGIVRGGDPVPGGGRLQLNGSGWSVFSDTTNELGQVAIISNIIEDESNVIIGQALFRGGLDGLKTVARKGQSVPAGSGTFDRFFSPQLNAVGQVAFGANVTRPTLGTDIGLYLGDGDTLTKIYRDGDPAPGMNDNFEYIDDDISLNDSGRVAFLGYTLSGGHGLFVGSGGPLTKILAPGDAAPFGQQFDAIYEPRQNNSGQIAVPASVVDPVSGDRTFGIYRTDGASTVRIVHAGQLAPDGDGPIEANGFFQFQMNDAGQVLFTGLVHEEELEYQSLLLGDGGDLRQIGRTGRLAPGGFGTITDFDIPKLNNRGQVAFTVELSDVVGGEDGDAALLFDGRNLIEIARFGQSMAGSTIVEAIVRDVNDNMQVAYDVQLADGRRTIARFEPTIYWRGPNNGSWEAAANWSLGVEPFDPYDAVIELANAGSIAGPFGHRILKSLKIGGENSAAARLELQRGVNLKTINGTVVRENGMLAGDGKMEGNVFNFAGVVHPGAQVGELEVDGDYSQSSRGTLIMEIAGPLPKVQYDLLTISGAATLGGTLEIYLLDGYGPIPGNNFSIITYNEIAGAFDSLSVPLLPNNYGWRLDYGATGLVLTVTPAALSGDADLDGDVDQADVAQFARSLGRSYGSVGFTTDPDHDGVTTLADLALLQANLGQAPAPAPSAAVPEPATVVVCFSALFALAWVRRRAPR